MQHQLQRFFELLQHCILIFKNKPKQLCENDSDEWTTKHITIVRYSMLLKYTQFIKSCWKELFVFKTLKLLNLWECSPTPTPSLTHPSGCWLKYSNSRIQSTFLHIFIILQFCILMFLYSGMNLNSSIFKFEVKYSNSRIQFTFLHIFIILQFCILMFLYSAMNLNSSIFKFEVYMINEFVLEKTN